MTFRLPSTATMSLNWPQLYDEKLLSLMQAGDAIIGMRLVGTLYPDGSFTTRGGMRALLWTRR